MINEDLVVTVRETRLTTIRVRTKRAYADDMAVCVLQSFPGADERIHRGPFDREVVSVEPFKEVGD